MERNFKFVNVVTILWSFTYSSFQNKFIYFLIKVLIPKKMFFLNIYLYDSTYRVKTVFIGTSKY